MNVFIKKDNNLFSIKILTVVIFIFLFIINYLFPITGDDLIAVYNQATTETIFSNILFFGNGRFLGNLLFYLVRLPVFCAFQKSFFWTGIIYILSKLVDIKSPFYFSILSLTILYPCASIFSQVYTWSAGFQNYVSPIFFILLSLLALKKYFKKNQILYGLLSCFPLFISQFFSENTSIFNVLLFLFLTVFFFIKNKKANIFLIIDTLTSVLGFGIMMFLPKILNVADKMNSYRNVSLSISSIIKTIIYNYRTFSDCMIGCFLLWIIMSASLLALKKNIFNNKILDNILSFILISVPCYSLMYDFFIKEFVTANFHIKTFVNMGLITAYFFSAFLIFIKCYLTEKKKYIFSAGLSFAMGLISFAPLLIVTPIGARTFYLPYICFILSALILITNNKDIKHINNQNVIAASILSVIAVLVTLTFTFYDVKISENVRNEYLAEEISENKKHITIPLLPHQELIHEDDSFTHWEYYFSFNNANPSYDFAPFESWQVIRNK